MRHVHHIQRMPERRRPEVQQIAQEGSYAMLAVNPTVEDRVAIVPAEVETMFDLNDLRLGEARRLTRVVAELLKVDREPNGYQSQLIERELKRMAADFDWAALGVIVVVQRADGTLWILDGQHRVEVVKRKGFGHRALDAIVFSGLTYEREVEIYLRMAQRKQKTTINTFHGRLLAGDPVALALEEIAKKHGVETHDRARNSNYGNPFSLSALGTALKLIERHGAESVDRAFDELLAVWSGQPNCLQGEVLEAMTFFLLIYPNERRLLRESMAKISPERFRDEMHKRMIADKYAKHKPQSYKPRTLLALRNKYRRSNELPDVIDPWFIEHYPRKNRSTKS